MAKDVNDIYDLSLFGSKKSKPPSPAQVARTNAASQARYEGQAARYAAMQGGVLKAPDDPTTTTTRNPGPVTRSTNTNNGGGGPSASELAARKAGKDASAKQNQATQDIINALLNSLGGFASGRDTQIANASRQLEASLNGILKNYTAAVDDYEESAEGNQQDQAAKSAANATNRARERISLLLQAASQGAGETDQFRSSIMAALNADANQQEIDRSFFDTERSINSQIAGANSQAESQRRSAWEQNQEQVGSAWNEYWKNYSDTMTNVQRTAASNTNVDSDYSTGFNADLRGMNVVDEASKYAGKTYQTENKDDEWFKNFVGRKEGKNTDVTSTSRAGAVQIAAPKSAEGATLRKSA